jgi:hypothetical protein
MLEIPDSEDIVRIRIKDPRGKDEGLPTVLGTT